MTNLTILAEDEAHGGVRLHGPILNNSGSSIALDAYLHENKARPTSYYAEDRGDSDQLHGIFHAHAHDMPYLEQWMGEMLDLRNATPDRPDGPPFES